MSLKVVLLTTETGHHLYYAWKMAERFPLQAILMETQSTAPRFDTFHPFEAQRDVYEHEALLEGRVGSFEEVAPVYRFDAVNSAGSLAKLDALGPEVILVFGTGKVFAPVIQSASVACLNLHGGNPEAYRGLDAHLWAVYKEDFGNLMTTLHHVDTGLDTGDIVFQSRLSFTRQSKLYELRSVNTRACVELSLRALEQLEQRGSVPSRRQSRRGVYYSFMPSSLKEDCVRKFERYVERLG